MTPETLQKLKEKHPSVPAPTRPTLLERYPPFVTASEVEEAIASFPNGSAGGINGLKFQYLKEMVGTLRGCDKDRFCRLLASSSDVMLRGEVLHETCPVLYGATLHAFSKKDGVSVQSPLD